MNLTDLATLAGQWQQASPSLACDFNGDGHVDLTDLTTLAGNWQVRIGLDATPGNPTDGGAYTVYSGATLEGFDGRVTAGDFVQQKNADCTLFAWEAAHPLTVANAVQADGAGFMVVFHRGDGSIVRVHTSAELPTWATPVDGSIIGAVVEKAWAYFRSGANTYASLNYGYPSEIGRMFDVPSAQQWIGGLTVSAATTWISSHLNAGIVPCSNTTATSLVANHAYTLTSLTVDAGGVAWVHLDNPWGWNDADVTVGTLIAQAPRLFYDLGN